MKKNGLQRSPKKKVKVRGGEEGSEPLQGAAKMAATAVVAVGEKVATVAMAAVDNQ